MSFSYEVLIREHHLDSYGHVNNATYLALLEEARWEIITERGYGYSKVQETGFGPVILDIHIKFMKELKLREKIKITLEVISHKGKVSVFKQQMIKVDGTIASETILSFGFFNLKERKLVSPSEAWLKTIGVLE